MKKLVVILIFLLTVSFSGFSQWYALPVAQAPGGQYRELVRPIANGVVFFSQSYAVGSHWYQGLNHISNDDLFYSSDIGMPSNLGPGNYNSTIVSALSERNKDTFAVNVYLSQIGDFSGGSTQTWLKGGSQYTNCSMPGFPAPLIGLNLTQNYLYSSYGSYFSSLNFSVHKRKLSTGTVTTFTSAAYEWPGKMQFINDSIGYLLCRSKTNSAKNYLLKTIDFGVSWSSVFIDSVSALSSFHFPSLNTGYILYKNGMVKKTVNGGSSWTALTTIITTQNLNCIRFINDNEGFAAGDSGFIVKTINSATTWLNEVTTCTNNIVNLHSFDTVVYFADNSKRLYKNSIPTGTGINELGNKKTNIHAYPNPAQDVINLKFDAPYTGDLIIYNALGNIITTLRVRDEEFYTINLSAFAEGIYFIKTNGNGCLKVVKQK